ncbi:hypothetical protein KCP71_21165 [Salmonella enterica subsp. enterica]|nr:hypothetical protein KCP71_21165 [Salmonella enterica subsp. enterica]
MATRAVIVVPPLARVVRPGTTASMLFPAPSKTVLTIGGGYIARGQPQRPRRFFRSKVTCPFFTANEFISGWTQAK